MAHIDVCVCVCVCRRVLLCYVRYLAMNISNCEMNYVSWIPGALCYLAGYGCAHIMVHMCVCVYICVCGGLRFDVG